MNYLYYYSWFLIINVGRSREYSETSRYVGDVVLNWYLDRLPQIQEILVVSEYSHERHNVDIENPRIIIQLMIREKPVDVFGYDLWSSFDISNRPQIQELLVVSEYSHERHNVHNEKPRIIIQIILINPLGMK